MTPEERLHAAILVYEAFPEFVDFAYAGMQVLGFGLSDIQADIADYMENGPNSRVVMAQRGEAKSTLAALYAVWRLTRNPAFRILVVSESGKIAKDMATLVTKLIMQWDILEYLRPDRSEGDRTATESFDVHWSLKGIEKSASVACEGIFGTLTGRRADTLIADDIETLRNAFSPANRNKISELAKEFSAICTGRDILCLGTPHTRQSIYNALPARGYDVRIWPGRVPSDEQMERYGTFLAPIVRAMAQDPSLRTGYGVAGDLGAPVDPLLRPEDNLVEQELAYGPEGFQLQYMLDATMADAMRQQLKVTDLVFATFDHEMVPEKILYHASPENRWAIPEDFPIQNKVLYTGHVPVGTKWVPIPVENRIMIMDPAGGGTDEMAWAIGGHLGPYIHLFHVGGLNGGLSEENTKHILALVKKWKIKAIKVESNMGHGLFEQNLRAALKADDPNTDVVVYGEYAKDQKERRIIDSMVSTLQRHHFIVHQTAVESDRFYCRKHAADKANDYSLFTQIDLVTYDRGSLKRDDRADAVSGLVRHFQGVLTKDADKEAEARSKAEFREFVNNPLGHPIQPTRAKVVGTRALLSRRRKQ